MIGHHNHTIHPPLSLLFLNPRMRTTRLETVWWVPLEPTCSRTRLVDHPGPQSNAERPICSLTSGKMKRLQATVRLGYATHRNTLLQSMVRVFTNPRLTDRSGTKDQPPHTVILILLIFAEGSEIIAALYPSCSRCSYHVALSRPCHGLISLVGDRR